MNKKDILFISKGEHAASTRYRALQYIPLLEEEGWKTCHLSPTSFFSMLKILHKAKHSDIVVILRKTFNVFYFKILRYYSKFLIYDFDDAIFCRSDGSHSKQRNYRFQKIASGCNQIWAGNSYLANQALKYNTSVIKLPTSIYPNKYLLTVNKSSKYFDLVWIGSRSTRNYIESHINILEEATKICSDLRLKIVADFCIHSSKLKIFNIPWSEENEAEALCSSHLGIAPMPDNSWTQGKCGLKVLQYMAAGLPALASPAGVNKDIIINGKNGFLVQTPHEWKNAIKKIADNPDMSKTMGDMGRSWVFENYSAEVTFKRISHALNQTP